MKNRFLFLFLILFPALFGFSLTDGITLIQAVESNNIQPVRELIADGADVNFLTEDGKTPLICAILRENAEMVDLLLKNGANPDFYAPGTLSPRRVAQLRNLTQIEVMLNGSVKPVPTETIRFIEMIRDNQTADFLSALAENPHLADRTVSEGASPLMYAAYWGKSVYVKTLLSRGADPNRKDSDGYTALHLAAVNGNTQTVKILMQYHSNPNLRTVDGMTPLMLAARNGHEQIVRFLIASGADWNIKSKEGLTFFDYGKSGLLR